MKVISYQMGEAPFVFSDAIVLTEEQEGQLSEQDIEGIKLERYREWYAIVTAPVEEQEQEPEQEPEQAVEEGLTDG